MKTTLNWALLGAALVLTSLGLAASSTASSSDPARLTLLSERMLEESILLNIEKAMPGSEVLIAHYIIFNDRFGMAVYTAALQAAQRGVQVKMIMDGIGPGPILPISTEQIALAELVGMKVRVFHPKFRKLFNAKNRMHDKIVYANDAIIIGSHGIWDISIDGRMYESDVMIRGGGILAEARKHFFDIWDSNEVVELFTPPSSQGEAQLAQKGPTEADLEHFVNRYKRRAFGAPIPTFALQTEPGFGPYGARGGQEIVVSNIRYAYDGAVRKKGRAVYDQVVELMATAEQTLDIVNPYPIFVDSLKEVIARLRSKGVKIRIVSASAAFLTGEFQMVGAAYLSQLPFFAQAGVEVFEYNPNFLHSKYVVVDGKRWYFGSSNLDPLSAHHNTENGIFGEEDPSASGTFVERLKNEIVYLTKSGHSSLVVSRGKILVSGHGRSCSGILCKWGIVYSQLTTDFFERRPELIPATE